MVTDGASSGSFDPAAIAALSFEVAYARLEEAVTRLQMGNLSLNDALAAYEEGMALSSHCQELLEHAELRVRVLDRAATEDEDDLEGLDDLPLGGDDDPDEPPF